MTSPQPFMGELPYVNVETVEDHSKKDRITGKAPKRMVRFHLDIPVSDASVWAEIMKALAGTDDAAKFDAVKKAMPGNVADTNYQRCVKLVEAAVGPPGP